MLFSSSNSLPIPGPPSRGEKVGRCRTDRTRMLWSRLLEETSSPWSARGLRKRPEQTLRGEFLLVAILPPIGGESQPISKVGERAANSHCARLPTVHGHPPPVTRDHAKGERGSRTYLGSNGCRNISVHLVLRTRQDRNAHYRKREQAGIQGGVGDFRSGGALSSRKSVSQSRGHR